MVAAVVIPMLFFPKPTQVANVARPAAGATPIILPEHARDGLTPTEWAVIRIRQGAQWAADSAAQGVEDCSYRTQQRLREREGWSSDWSRAGATVARIACGIAYSPLAMDDACLQNCCVTACLHRAADDGCLRNCTRYK